MFNDTPEPSLRRTLQTCERATMLGRPREPESQLARELRYVENVEEVKARISILEQMLADQPGSKDLQEKLADARLWQKTWEHGLSAVQDCVSSYCQSP